MNPTSALTTALFSLLVLAVAALAARAIVRAAPGRTAALAIGAFSLFYLLIPAALALSGALNRYTPLPAPALVLIAALTVTTTIVAFSRFGARLVSSVGVAGLVGFQAFRILVELLLHRLFTEGVVPIQMTYAGRNFDIVSGLTAAAFGLALALGWRAPRGWLLAWNVMAVTLLANIVVVAVLSTPVPFRRFMQAPPNLLPSTFPFVWLPTFLVQAALFGHLLMFRSLRGSRRLVAD